MQSTQQTMILLRNTILCFILGAWFILVGPVPGQSQIAMALTPPPPAQIASAQTRSPVRIPLDPNTAYKVDRTPTPKSRCSNRTANILFDFQGEQFPDGQFLETYPIQDNWDLVFNTPNFEAGYFEDTDGCGLVPEQMIKSE